MWRWHPKNPLFGSLLVAHRGMQEKCKKCKKDCKVIGTSKGASGVSTFYCADMETK